MRYDPTRCAHCGGPPRPFRSEYGLDRDGRMATHDPFFFCSDDCLAAEMNRFMPKELSIGRTIGDDPEYKSLLKTSQDARRRFFPPNRLYSNEEKAERQKFDEEESKSIAGFEERWAKRRHDAIRAAIRDISETWHAHTEQKSAQEDAKRREAEQKHQAELAEVAAERAAFEQMIAPRPIPEHLRIHTAIVAKTGWGKTQLLQRLTMQELHKPDPPSMVILDSTGAMVDRIQHLALFNDRLKERLLIIDPAYSPALNMFDVSSPRFSSYTPEQKEGVQSDIIGLFDYIFASKEYDLSGQQGLGFIYAVRLILAHPGYTITHLRHLLEEAPKTWEQSKFADDIRALDQDAQDFFRHHFYMDSLKTTKAGIARRLHALIAIPTFRRMFTAGRNVLDLYHETQEAGSIVLVNTNQRLLGREGYILFGRYVVARLMASALERAHIPERSRRTTHLLIDEAAPYFDEKFDDLLTQVRQYGLRVTIAFQHLEQLSDKLKNSVAGQTSVKYVGGLSPLDERRLAAQIRCEEDFLRDLGLDINDPPQWSDWAVYADGLTKHPMKMRLPFYELENEPKMTDEQYQSLLKRTLARVAPQPEEPLETHKAEAPLVGASRPAPEAAGVVQAIVPQPPAPQPPDGDRHTTKPTRW
jgi:hypothetical protein